MENYLKNIQKLNHNSEVKMTKRMNFKYSTGYSDRTGGGYTKEDNEQRSLFNRLNKYKNKNTRVLFKVESSPYVGNTAYMIYASTLKDLEYGIGLAKQYGYFDGDTIKHYINIAKENW